MVNFSIRSDEGLTLETSVFKLFTVATLPVINSDDDTKLPFFIVSLNYLLYVIHVLLFAIMKYLNF